MYTIRQIITGVRNLNAASTELHKKYFEKCGDHSGANFFNEDWDNLIILDACRYDLFSEVASLEGELIKKESVASQTEEFLRKLVHGKSYPDTVYVSANPQLTKINAEFSEIVELWETMWDNEMNTVPPKSVAEAALTAQENWPNKRLVIHFVQPHIPFIGTTGREIPQPSLEGGTIDRGEDAVSVWKQLANGDLSKNTAWEAYRENLQVVLPVVEDLLEDLDGKSVVTSDHGNMFGKRHIYGHPSGVHLKELVEVPWLVRNGERRTITDSSSVKSTKSVANNTVESRLSDLGYL